MDLRSSVVSSPLSSPSTPTNTSASPPPVSFSSATSESGFGALHEAEEKARQQNDKAKARRAAAVSKRWTNKMQSKAERESKARELDDLLLKSAAFSDILTKKTEALGRVGTSLAGDSLGNQGLKIAEQPKCMVGGEMRQYQLEGLTWMYEICLQGMSGILADEMGLGKTIQTISLIALLREQEGYLGPHLIVAPLSTLSNWIAEFRKWVPSLPVVLYHGDPKNRQEIMTGQITRHIQEGRPTEQFPIVCTSYEIILRDRAQLSKITWEFIIIDEGHRMKNFDSKLFRELRTFRSATRLLITGTPLQNNLRELWSLLNFLLPELFVNWEAFESWFDFSDLQDEEGTQDFIEDRMKQDLVRKIHLILQPLLLRRVKADVAADLPMKREYVLFAPMTKEQTDLYNAISDQDVDTRAFLEAHVADQFSSEILRSASEAPTGAQPVAKKDSGTGSTPFGQKMSDTTAPKASSTRKDAFSVLMRGPVKNGSKITDSEANIASSGPKRGVKRKTSPEVDPISAKRPKPSRDPTPSRDKVHRSRRGRQLVKEVDSDDDLLEDDEFEEKLASLANAGSVDDLDTEEEALDPQALERRKALKYAKKETAQKKLGNPLMQLRLVCNSPHNFYDPFPDSDVSQTIVTASGKMLLLDRLLPALFDRGHKVLIFSQFRTQLDLLEAYCHQLRGWNICRIDGGVSQEDRATQIANFNSSKEHRVFLLSTRAGGQGINLASADTVILFDSDWNPQQDLQAQDRCHRIGQTRPVIVYRLATKGTVEEDLLVSAGAKRRLEKLVIRKGGFQAMTRKASDDNGGDDGLDAAELRALLLKDGLAYKWADSENVLSDRDIKTICDRSDEAYTRAAQGHGNADVFKVVETGANGITEAGTCRS